MSLENVNAERFILSILLNKPDVYFEVSDVLSSADFTNSGNQAIFSLVEQLIKDGTKTIDVPLLLMEAEKRGLDRFLEQTLDGDLIEALIKLKPRADNVGKFISEVKQSTIKRALINTLDEAKDQVVEFSGPAVELRNLIEAKVLGTIQSLDSDKEDMVSLSEDFENVINTYADNPSGQGLDIGMPKWQKDCGGIRNGTITGVFARSKAGKSQHAMWALYQTGIINRLPVLYLDTELQAREQMMRLCGMMTKIPYEEIESGKWRGDAEKLKKIKEAFKIIKGAPIFYRNIAGMSVQHIIPTIRKFATRYLNKGESNKPTGLVIYDYIKLMSSNDLAKAQEYQLLGFLVSELHDLAVQLNFPLMAYGQLNRDALKLDSELAAAGADRIVHLVDSFTIMRVKKPEEIDNDGRQRGNYVFKVCVARYGAGHESSNEWVNVHFDKSCGQFQEDRRNSEVQENITMSNPEIRDALNDDADIMGFGEVKIK